MAQTGYRHVTRDQRSQIHILMSTGFSIRKIAKAVQLSPSTISRELKRNSGPRVYNHEKANKLAKDRRSKASSSPKKMTPELKALIIAKLKTGWSPEQISGRLKLESGTSISHEAIYQLILKDRQQGGTLYLCLRHRSKPYNRRKNKTAGRGCIPNRIDIDKRPQVVEEKTRIGDWEGDTIIGAKHKGAIVSYVDRHSKYTLLQKVDTKTSECVTEATLEKMQSLPHPVLTITYDNGKEFANHSFIAAQLNAECFFAKPYHSWERGLNEHTNGLVRQYLPKTTDFRSISNKKVQEVEKILNYRPRKILQYQTPFEVFYDTTLALCSNVALPA